MTQARKIMVLAEPFHMRSAFHGAADMGPVASVSLQAVIPNFGVEVVSGVPETRDGFLYPSERPGLGVDEDKAARYPYQRAYMPLVRRADGSMHVY